jgi:hypothetical protein
MRRGLKTLGIILVYFILLVQIVYAQSTDVISANDENVSDGIIDSEQNMHDSEIENIKKIIITERTKIINNIIDKIPIILSSAVSIIALLIGYRTGMKQNSLNLITNNRIAWQETIRKELADFIGDLFTFSLQYYYKVSNSNYDNKDTGSIDKDIEFLFSAISKLNVEGNRLVLRLNPIEDAKIIEIIKNIIDIDLPNKPEDIGKSFSKIQQYVSELVSESHIMLKNEWEKIKKEASYAVKPK